MEHIYRKKVSAFKKIRKLCTYNMRISALLVFTFFTYTLSANSQDVKVNLTVNNKSIIGSAY